MQALPFVVSLILAALLAPGMLRALEQGGAVRENYRGVVLPFPAGVVMIAVALLALVILGPVEQFSDGEIFRPEFPRVAIYALGVAFLGLVDDLFSGESRGWRGHGAAVLRGAASTGALKAAGSLALACYVLADTGLSAGRYVLAVLLLALTTNLLNLLDLRPGRASKVFVLLGIVVTLGAWDFAPGAALGLFTAPILVLGLYDVRERAMLGDTGSNLLGGLAGLWLVLALGLAAQIAALLVILAITLYGEFRSISALIERNPLLRSLDSIGRPHAQSPSH